MYMRSIVPGKTRRWFIGVGSVCAALMLAVPVPASAHASARPGEAPGGPGATSYLDMARKDCFGTARNTRSKVWFTVADGVLSDVFSPTIENTNVSTVQYIVTDGRTFTALQQRDMTYSVSSPDPSGMVCRVTSTDRAHRFRLISDYITDPARDSVVIHTTLVPIGDARSVRNLKVYVRYDATIDNTGGGGKANGGPNNATIDPATTALVSSDTTAPKGPFSAPVVGALLANRPFLAESSGFVGSSSDGLRQLDAHHRLVKDYRSATRRERRADRPGRHDAGPAVHAGAGLRARRRRGDRRGAELAPPRRLGRHSRRYIAGWRSYDALAAPPTAASGRAHQGPGRRDAAGPTGCRPTSSRPLRTRRMSARSWPRRPTRGASRFRPPPPMPAGPIGRCSLVTATRRSPDCSPTATGPALGT